MQSPNSLASLNNFFSNRTDQIFSIFNNRPVSNGELLNHASYLSQNLTGKQYIINLCQDRYLFSVAFLAGMISKCPNLLPPNQAKQTLSNLMLQYPDSICITDNPELKHETYFINSTFFSECDVTDTPIFDPEQIVSISFTSGSTGQPKVIAKTLREFQRGTQLATQQLDLDNRNLTVIATVPPQHMYGLETSLFWPLYSDLVIDSGKPFFPEDIRNKLCLAKTPCLLVATPRHLKSCVEANLKWQNIDRILSSTAPMSLQLAEQVEHNFNAPLYEIFGSTETLSYASRRLTQSPHWQPYQGIRIKQQQEQQFFVSGGHLENPVPLDDQFLLEKNGNFSVIGRLADLIKIAGKRASLLQLNNILQSIKGVEDGVFYLTDQERLGALVVGKIAKKQLLNELKQHIDPVFLPRPLHFVEQLPRNEVGKLVQSKLEQLIQQTKPCQK
jgi:acyl-coenzyme A synthetase/AMP-(fatty) acid ligase